MYFEKFHACGNDFIIVDNRFGEIKDLPETARQLCDRHTGVGADTLLVIENSEIAEYKMGIYNADGSTAEMCGNGIRCFAKYLFDEDMVDDKVVFDIETKKGIIGVELVGDDNSLGDLVTVNMGEVKFNCRDIPMVGEDTFIARELEVDGRKFTVTSVNTGIPQTVVVVDDLDGLDIAHYGRLIENHPLYPEHTNVNFVQVISKEAIRSRAWERGCGATLACGTGACAAAAACYTMGLTEREVEVQVELGSLFIDYNEDGTALLTGPAVKICDGEAELECERSPEDEMQAIIDNLNEYLDKACDGDRRHSTDLKELFVDMFKAGRKKE